MSDKLDIDIDVAHLTDADPDALAALRVGQRLTIARHSEDGVLLLCNELGVRLAPLSETQLMANCLQSKAIVRAIKRDITSGAIQQLQARIYRVEDAGRPLAGVAPITAAEDAAPAGNAQVVSASEDHNDYKLRKAQYQALADSEQLRAMLANPHLQLVLAQIDDATDRERALAAQLETPDFQDFVSQVLKSLDPERVPATAATVAAVAMATR
ncbi:hypothetical protein Vretimale_15707 [Volvox reticuliferus]|uniref:Zinc finger HIT domain-containing protein n=1 Tax=Volvox reticuliferus TaxID=1737510 RepID=A0A8J4CX14_9CHLO|nr:hypothetical protein Vretifemale_18389 [Volvox reticuliferus]GIM12350.1 hypothetical protein Vretimale_15707 [Volvox reticuliferus]